MGKLFVNLGGGGGIGSDELTAKAANVLSGMTFVGNDTNDEIGTGTMPNNGAVSPTALSAGGSYTIPAGYHNGSGKVTANTLASQTAADATAAQILSGKTAWVNGTKLTGSMAVQSAISFKATAQSATVIRISWTNPSKGPWEGVEIRMSTSGNPGVSGGTQKYKGRGNNATAGGSNYVDITGLSLYTTYYFTCTSYASGLGNGASYNVSARTSELVLWNGSSLQNGAVWLQGRSDYRFRYSFSAGFLTNKKLAVVFKQNASYHRIIVSPFDGRGVPTDCNVDPNCNVGIVNPGAWTANKEYVIELNKADDYAYYLEFRNVISMDFRFCWWGDRGEGEGPEDIPVSLSTYVAKVALRA